MKNKEHRNTLLAIIVVALVTVVFFTIYLIPSDAFGRTKVFFEPMGNFSMQIPSSFSILREKIGEDEAVIKVMSPNDLASANPGLTNMVLFKQAEDKTLREQAASFLSVEESHLIPFSFKYPAFSYLSQNGQEQSYYYFIQNNGYNIVYKFNKSYFDKNNPLILIDNSVYSNTVLRTLSSIKLDFSS